MKRSQLFRRIASVAFSGCLLIKSSTSTYVGRKAVPLETSGASLDDSDDLDDLWVINEPDISQESKGFVLTYDHGTGGFPSIKIFASAGSISETDPLTGSSCRSFGGQLVPDPVVGLTIIKDTYKSTTASSFNIQVDPFFITTNPMISIPLEDGSGSITQFCVCFSLLNEQGEDINFVETEARVVLRGDGTVAFNVMETRADDPFLFEFSNSIGITASLCDGTAPPEHQGDLLSVCIQSNDTILSLLGVETFAFESSNNAIQPAFSNGLPASAVTRLVSSGGGTLQFDHILDARFYGREPTTVTGYGVCTVALGTRRRVRFVAEKKDNAGVHFRFPVGAAEEVTEENSNSSTLLLSIFLGSALMIIVAVCTSVMFYFRRNKASSAKTKDETETEASDEDDHSSRKYEIVCI